MSTPTSAPNTPIGVGFDTARYGHHVTFLRADLQPACAPFDFPESRAGYDRVHARFDELAGRWPDAHFHIRLDVAGQYAANLEAFLRALPYRTTLSVGEPGRNANYRKALFPKRKADPVESLCAARFAVRELPKAAPARPFALQQLREVLGRLQTQVRQSTRLTNQLHNLLARVFPELATLAKDLQAQWVLGLLRRYPTPAQLGRAHLSTLSALPHLSAELAQTLRQAARRSVASLTGACAEQLVGQLVRQLSDALVHEEQLHQLMTTTYRQLPQPNHLESIPGIGPATAEVLTATVVDIGLFATPDHLVGYFGIFPEEDTSGCERDGTPKTGRQQRMSRKGNDLVRKHLWQAALAAIRWNPAVRALHQRLRARGVRGDVVVGHCMRKLLHLAHAIWRTGRPFDPGHYPWQGASTCAASVPPALPVTKGSVPGEGGRAAETGAEAAPAEQAARHKQEISPAETVVSAAATTITGDAVPGKGAAGPVEAGAGPGDTGRKGSIDYAALRAQVSMAAALRALDWLERLRGGGPQRRGPCPIHDRDQQRHRSFSVHLDKGVFQCFHAGCGAHGNVLDLWSAVHGLPLYEAAQQLAQTLGITVPLLRGTEKRNP
jgi:transposase